MTFDALDALAGTLARRLVGSRDGTGTRVPVPLLLGRDTSSVIAIHGALRAGVPCALLDSSLPKGAIEATLARLGGPTVAVVTDPEQRRLLPDLVTVIDAPSAVEDPLPPQPVPPDGRAMVLFTSGSSGRPKGVVYEWAMVDARSAFLHETLSDGPHEHLACMHPLHWLGGLSRALAPGFGSSVAIIDPSRLDRDALLDRLAHEAVTKISVVPSMAAMLASAKQPRLETVREVRTLGEALTWEDVAHLRAIVPSEVPVVSLYGSSEALASGLRFVVAPGDPLGHGRVPLGTPAGPPGSPASVRIVPSDDAPPGCGEIVMGGSIAGGYLDDPAATRARFLVEDGIRWWRSGDLGARAADGVVRHLGRIDDLVKIRGQLVEPSEPERVLRQLPGVRRAAVVARTSARGATRLVAHLELEADSTLTPGETRARLTAELAPHLVPSSMVSHSALPLTASGKVDYATLRRAPVQVWRVDECRAGSGGGVDDLERAVVGLVREILDVDGVQPDDNLWEIGLDSLAAVELAAGCSELGSGTLDPTVLAAHDTPTRIAELLRQGFTARSSDVVTLNPTGSRSPLFCIPGAGGTALAFRPLAVELGAERPVVVIEAHGLHAPGRPDRSIEHAARRAATQIELLQPRGTVVVVGHSAGGAVAYATATELHGRGRSVQPVLLDTSLPDRSRRAADHGTRARRLRNRLASRPRREVAVWALRRARYEGARARAALRALHPGPPAADARRYETYFAIGTRALRRFTPEAAPFPVTLLHTPHVGDPQQWRSVAPHLRIHAVPGDHLTMLHPPHVERIARHLDDLLDGPLPVTPVSSGLGGAEER